MWSPFGDNRDSEGNPPHAADTSTWQSGAIAFTLAASPRWGAESLGRTSASAVPGLTVPPSKGRLSITDHRPSSVHVAIRCLEGLQVRSVDGSQFTGRPGSRQVTGACWESSVKLSLLCGCCFSGLPPSVAVGQGLWGTGDWRTQERKDRSEPTGTHAHNGLRLHCPNLVTSCHLEPHGTRASGKHNPSFTKLTVHTSSASE